MLDLIAALRPAQTAAFSLQRGGAAIDLTVTVGKRPAVRRDNVDRN